MAADRPKTPPGGRTAGKPCVLLRGLPAVSRELLRFRSVGLSAGARIECGGGHPGIQSRNVRERQRIYMDFQPILNRSRASRPRLGRGFSSAALDARLCEVEARPGL